MTLRQYLFTMFIATVMCWVAFVFVLINTDPFETNTTGFIFFYISLFLSLIGTISMLAFTLYHIFLRKKVPMYKYVKKSFRDSVIISISLISLLYLQSLGFLNIWMFIGFLVILALIISFSLSLKTTSKKNMPVERIDSMNTN